MDAEKCISSAGSEKKKTPQDFRSVFCFWLVRASHVSPFTFHHSILGFRFRLFLYMLHLRFKKKVGLFLKVWSPERVNELTTLILLYTHKKIGLPLIWQRPAGPLWQTTTHHHSFSDLQLKHQELGNGWGEKKSVSEVGISQCFGHVKPMMPQVTHLASMSGKMW